MKPDIVFFGEGLPNEVWFQSLTNLNTYTEYKYNNPFQFRLHVLHVYCLITLSRFCAIVCSNTHLLLSFTKQ